jgi:hypothetical protein
MVLGQDAMLPNEEGKIITWLKGWSVNNFTKSRRPVVVLVGEFALAYRDKGQANNAKGLCVLPE